MTPTETLNLLFTEAVAAADPLKCLPGTLPAEPRGRTVVIGAGKASGAMARAVENEWQGELSGLVVTRYDYALPCERIEIIEASHPVPDAKGRAAAGRILEMAKELGPDDLCIALISGGASSLLSMPAEGLTLEDKQAINRELLRCGATISEMNCVRKHLSAIKGGRLAAAIHPARLVTLMISDVPGDDPGVIGSGPTVADETTFADAMAITRKYNLNLPPAAQNHLEVAASETPKPGDPVFENSISSIIALPKDSLARAAEAARNIGITPYVLGDDLEGESRDVAREQAALALKIAAGEGPVKAPAVILSGGETTVTIKGSGRGGRNSEFMLALAIALEGAANIYGISCDTDGIDGSEDNAGAQITPDTLERATKINLDPGAYLDNNDSYNFFGALNDLIMTGPTFTNVNDFRAILVL